MPKRSTTVTFFTPAAKNLRVTESPAEPPPLTTTLTSSIDFPISFKALYKAAKTTIAVPC